MGGFLNTAFGQTAGSGLSQALVMPAPSLALMAQRGRSQASDAASGAAAPFALAGAPIGSGAPQLSSGMPQLAPSPDGGAAGRSGAPSGGGSAPSGVAPSPAQLAAYRTGVENELTSVYSRAAAAIPRAMSSGLGPSAGETALEEYIGPEPNLAPLTAAEKALLGPGISNSWPWGPGAMNFQGSALEAGNPALQSNAFSVPGTAPGSFYPANMFGDVTGAASEAPPRMDLPFPGAGPLGGPSPVAGLNIPQATSAQLAANAPVGLSGGTPQWAAAVPRQRAADVALPPNPWVGSHVAPQSGGMGSPLPMPTDAFEQSSLPPGFEFENGLFQIEHTGSTWGGGGGSH